MTSFWHPIWTSWGPLGAIFGALWRLMRPSWDRLGLPWCHLGASWGHLGTSWSLLVALLEPLAAILGPLGPSGAHREPIWVPFCLILGRFWIHFGTVLDSFFDILNSTCINRNTITEINSNQSKPIKINPNQ